jgi:hypothetical protein
MNFEIFVSKKISFHNLFFWENKFKHYKVFANNVISVKYAKELY